MGMQSDLFYKVVDGVVERSINEIDGKTLTRPLLAYSDGRSLAYCVDVDIGSTVPLRNVPIAANAEHTYYAEVGSAVRLRRTKSGWFEVIGPSKRMPGTLTHVPVRVPRFTTTPMSVYAGPDVPAETGGVVVGVGVSVGITSRRLSYGELASMGGYGVLPYGSIAFYSGGTLIGVNEY